MLLFAIFLSVESKNDEYAIFNHVFENYNPEVRPSTVNEVIKVEIALSMQQMINLDEKRETVTISAFPEYTWVDRRLTWDPEKFNQQHTINLPVEKIWQPSIILYSNTDGIYDPTVPVMVPVKSSGRVHWMPPGIFRTKCKIDVSLFPFDWQNCSMAFRTYNYDKNEVQLAARDTQVIIDQFYYQSNGEWDLIFCPAKSTSNDAVEEVTFFFIFRRKSLFYIITFVVPCILITLLSVGTFIIPVASNQKIHLAISVFMGLTVYLSMLARLTPETESLPLLSRFLMVSLMSVSLSILASVLVIWIHYNGNRDCDVPESLRRIIFQPCSKRLFSKLFSIDRRTLEEEFSNSARMKRLLSKNLERRNTNLRKRLRPKWFHGLAFFNSIPIQEAASEIYSTDKFLEKKQKQKALKDRWMLLAMIVDRILLILYLIYIVSLGIWFINEVFFCRTLPSSAFPRENDPGYNFTKQWDSRCDQQSV